MGTCGNDGCIVICGSFITGIDISGIYISGISNYLNGIGKDGPVTFGRLLSNTLGISPWTLESTSFINLFLNCSEVTYLNVKKPPPTIPKTSTVDKIVKASRIFRMIKYQIIRACSLMSLVVLLLIIAISPLYVTMGLMTRQMQELKR